MDKDEVIQIRLSAAEKERVVAVAAKRGRKLSEVIREFLMKWVKE